jgi:putative hydroxymethylpyrimidine transport system permease protein
MARLVRTGLTLAGLVAVWAAVVAATGVPAYLLPGPDRVARVLVDRADVIARHAGITLVEILLGLAVGVIAGTALALALAASAGARRWLLPLVVGSQAIPIFAIAPLLVLWLGYGLASKVAAAALIIFFPIAVTLHQGLARAERDLLDAARCLGAGRGSLLWRVRLPAALPAFGQGLRLAAAVAPIGAVIGEWVGAGAGLGYLMLQANARMQIDVMFAALIVLIVMAVLLHAVADRLADFLTPWAPAPQP